MNKFTEVAAFYPVSTWVPLANYQQYSAFARAGTASPTDSVTVQLRKATNAGGSNAANQGAAVTGHPHAETSVRAEDLGNFSAGVPFTHVSAVVTDAASPNTVVSAGILTQPRFAGQPA